jgi:hypothetical protein
VLAKETALKIVLATLSLVILAVGCASAPPLPEDMRITAPSGDLPRALSNYSGIWEGNWGQQAFKVVIESIDATKAKGVYSWGEWRST